MVSHAVPVGFVEPGNLREELLKGFNRWDAARLLVVGDLCEVFKVDERARPLDFDQQQGQTPHYKHSGGLVIIQSNMLVILVAGDGAPELLDEH